MQNIYQYRYLPQQVQYSQNQLPQHYTSPNRKMHHKANEPSNPNLRYVSPPTNQTINQQNFNSPNQYVSGHHRAQESQHRIADQRVSQNYTKNAEKSEQKQEPQSRQNQPSDVQVQEQLKRQLEVNQKLNKKLKEQQKIVDFTDELQQKIRLLIEEKKDFQKEIQEIQTSRQDIVTEFQQKVQMLVDENMRLQSILQEQEGKISGLLRENEAMQELVQDENSQIQDSNIKDPEYKFKYEVMVKENESLRQLNQNMKQENQSINQENNDLVQQIEKLMKKQENQEMRSSILQTNNSNLMDQKFEILLLENEKLNKLLQKEVKKNEELQSKQTIGIETLMGQLIQENTNLSNQLDSSQKLYQDNLNGLQQKLNQLENQLSEKQKNIQELKSQFQNQKDQISQRDLQITSQKCDIVCLENQIKRLSLQPKPLKENQARNKENMPIQKLDSVQKTFQNASQNPFLQEMTQAQAQNLKQEFQIQQLRNTLQLVQNENESLYKLIEKNYSQ